MHMNRTIVLTVSLALLGVVAQADAQGRYNRGQSRTEIARAQGVPPGQLPPANLCRVWYENRAPGRQPSPTNCRNAEAVASRDRNARVIYGEGAYDARYGYGYGNGTYDDRSRQYPDYDRGVERNGRVRDPRYGDPRYNDRLEYSPAFQQGYRDGLDKGREDANDRDRFDPNRHGWYRSADRGYDDDYGSKSQYQTRYREGFQSGYSEGYRVYTRR
jgi:hypothetical protein